MAKATPNTYRISRILRRLLGFGFKDSFLKSDVSPEAMLQSNDYTSSHGPISLLHPNGQKPNGDSSLEIYVKYQKEIQAKKHLDASQKPETPGRILRLPPQSFFESDPEE